MTASYVLANRGLTLSRRSIDAAISVMRLLASLVERIPFEAVEDLHSDLENGFSAIPAYDRAFADVLGFARMVARSATRRLFFTPIQNLKARLVHFWKNKSLPVRRIWV